MSRALKAAGKCRLPRSTKFPSQEQVATKCKELGLDLIAEEPGQESSKELTDWYVAKFCSANNLKPTTL